MLNSGGRGFILSAGCLTTARAQPWHITTDAAAAHTMHYYTFACAGIVIKVDAHRVIYIFHNAPRDV
jgi:hypothetical protein